MSTDLDKLKVSLSLFVSTFDGIPMFTVRVSISSEYTVISEVRDLEIIEYKQYQKRFLLQIRLWVLIIWAYHLQI